MTLRSQVQAALAGPGATLPAARAAVPARPGLYAVHGDAAAWEQLGLGRPPDRRPLYVGKAEGSLAGRDLRQHFSTGSTGSSTLRRSLAALLRARLGLVAVPRNRARPERFAHYALGDADEARLTAWMEQHLTLAVWVPDDPVELGAVEGELLGSWQPPLNLAGVTTRWTKRWFHNGRSLRAQISAQAK
jgi:hypothetical protein